MFMFISIQYFTEKLVESYFVTIYNVKNEKMAYFLNFMVFREFWGIWAWPVTCDFLRLILKTILMHMGHH